MSCCLFPFLDDYFSANLFPTINCHPARNVSPKVIFCHSIFRLSPCIYLHKLWRLRLWYKGYKGPSRDSSRVCVAQCPVCRGWLLSSDWAGEWAVTTGTSGGGGEGRQSCEMWTQANINHYLSFCWFLLNLLQLGVNRTLSRGGHIIWAWNMTILFH